MTTNLKWSDKNKKLRKLRTTAFDLPAFKSADGEIICIGALHCVAVCYARATTFTWPLKRAAMEHNYAFAKQANFAELAIADLERKRALVVRIHASGDFFSQAYLNAWIQIASAFPDKTFYAYTKALTLDFSRVPANFKVIQSLGGKFDAMVNLTLPHSRIFSSVAARKRAGYVDGNKNDKPAIVGETRIGLVYHGQRNLTPAQVEHFA